MSEAGLSAPAIRIESCDPCHPDAVLMIERLNAALLALTGDSGAASFDVADVTGPGARFVLARNIAGQALGCGAYRPLIKGVAEIKRMFAMGGAGATILEALEHMAKADGYCEVRLSTRICNARAVAFYERHGYRPVAPWGRYVGRSQSVCLGKDLVPENGTNNPRMV